MILDRYAGPTALARGVRLRQRAVPHRPRGAWLRRRPPRPRQLHQDAALAGQLAEHGVPRRRAAEGGGRVTATIASRSTASSAVTWRVPAALKELGYQYIHVSNWWPPTMTNVDADRTFHYDGQDEFSTVLAQTTLLRAFTEPEAAPTDPWDWRVLRAHSLYELDRLDEIPALPGPKFVFAHILLPARPVRLRQRRLVHGPRAGRRAGPAGELPAPAAATSNDRMIGMVDRIIAGVGRGRRDHDPGRRGAVPRALPRRRMGLPVARRHRRRAGGEVRHPVRHARARRRPRGRGLPRRASRRSTRSASSSTPASGPISRCSRTACGPTRTCATSTTSSRSPTGSPAERFVIEASHEGRERLRRADPRAKDRLAGARRGTPALRSRSPPSIEARSEIRHQRSPAADHARWQAGRRPA